MRSILTTAFVLILLGGTASATSLAGSAPPKVSRPFPPNVPAAVRQGGDTIADAIMVPGLPFADTGTTTGYQDDYDEVCPNNTPGSPDVVYAFVPISPLEIDIDMLGSSYDTKIYLYDAAQNLVACNDDYYPDYVSALSRIPVDPAAAPYHLIIDGYGGEHGEYVLQMTEYVPCVIDLDEWDIVDEDEPPLEDFYVDAHNGGCNSPQYGNPFQAFGPGFPSTEYRLGGRSGWYFSGGWPGNSRDTDWFLTRLDSDGHLRFYLDAEEETYLFQLGPLDCDSLAVLQQVVAGPCSRVSMDVAGEPFAEIWLWVGPTTFTPPSGFVGHEYSYLLEVWDFQWPAVYFWAANDYTLPAPAVVYPQTNLVVDPDSACIDDVDLAVLCGGVPTPGPDYFARVYLGAGDHVGGVLFPYYIAQEPARREARVASLSLALVSDLRDPDATCLGVAHACYWNQYYSFAPAAESGWYFLVADYRDTDLNLGWAEIYHPATPPPPPPAHDDCAGAAAIPPGAIAIDDDLTNCTNAVDPGRDGCGGRRDLMYTSRDAVYRVDFAAGQTLDIVMAGDGAWDEALYLVRDCEQPLGNCFAAGVTEGDSVHLSYTSLEDQTAWLVCDSWGVGPRRFTLTGSLGTTTDVPSAPGLLALRAAPNPFNPRATIAFDLPRESVARLRIHSLDGRVVTTLIDGAYAAGCHETAWGGRDDHGRSVASGVYLVRLEAGGERRSLRVTLLK
ncbi:MAG TPA: FlgD immunoglobulin-like domain containing protein [Candidatus Krumholzibacteria bacterium]|nr:FlgD immunoglobulin-like domain containing protein [Candidatus Krumholzibacteria bacterium]HPD70312.1 FlgD immunoglobulin-like domain containing protein [Candidatus Krumholzibacteria bacterium]HRY39988.1 FlgD immunoglobulin-like domain containing protein [Candidatus Krumholzibacteria bacterium]